MQVTYIMHSCFLVESDKNLFLFDYFDGKIPPLNNNKPLYCFASHSHGDHFSEKLFEATASHPSVHYILSDDIFKSRVPLELSAKVDFISPSQTVIIDNIGIKTLKSTDLGVAFIVDEDGRLIYHAGDLNDWQWEEESSYYNRKMEADYINEIKKLGGMYFKLAFLPLDSRQSSEIRQKGIKIFLEYANAENIFPMHLWDNYSMANELALTMGPEMNAIFRNAKHKGETFTIKED